MELRLFLRGDVSCDGVRLLLDSFRRKVFLAVRIDVEKVRFLTPSFLSEFWLELLGVGLGDRVLSSKITSSPGL